MKVCLVTLVVGDAYYAEYERYFLPSQRTYAKAVGYDHIVLRELLGSLQKIDMVSLCKQLVCSETWASEYDYLVMVDADVWINPSSPPIHLACADTDKIGMVNEYDQPTRTQRIAFQAQNGWETEGKTYYGLCGFDFDSDKVYNGGLFVFQPRKHAEFTKDLYVRNAIQQIGHPRGLHFEQTLVNVEYQRADMILELPHIWNAIWSIQKTFFKGSLSDFARANYFVHFAGAGGGSYSFVDSIDA
jgi:hypothetical protein